MFLRIIPVGELRTNCYIVADEAAKLAMIIDPGSDADRILPVISRNNFKVLYIINTHGHYDHVGANGPVQKFTGAPIMMHERDLQIMDIMREWASVDSPAPDQKLTDGQVLEIGSLKFTVWHTPGHSSGGVSLVGEGVVFSGDTLFSGCVGRYDLPGSSKAELKQSLERLMTLPDETIVYPGHDVKTTIGAERRVRV
ncbi:MAG: MBL fold metallo-hydrolase [Candidatus Margulisiibacteriota bacterium]|jgi:glyoxylase-like metal-dependent hydrolase (beta-lactamase superfamily II)